jgi:hypothetical protein
VVVEALLQVEHVELHLQVLRPHDHVVPLLFIFIFIK